MIKVLFFSLMIISTSGVANVWRSNFSTDQFTDEPSAYAVNGKLSMQCSGSEVLIAFDWGQVTATPNSLIDLRVRIDKNKMIVSKAKNFSNSYESGFLIGNNKAQIVSQFKTGNFALIEPTSLSRSYPTITVNLKGFTKTYNLVSDHCSGKLDGNIALKKIRKEKENEKREKLERQNKAIETVTEDCSKEGQAKSVKETGLTEQQVMIKCRFTK